MNPSRKESTVPTLSRRDFHSLLAASALAPEKRAGLLRATHGTHIAPPQHPPYAGHWVYEITFPFQLAPRLAAISAALKPGKVPGQDYAAGIDIIPFADHTRIDTRAAVAITRNHIGTNPNAGGRTVEFAKYPDPPGFIPLGARRSDGTPHPHAGTGFGTSRCAAWHTVEEEKEPRPRVGDRPMNRRSFYKGAEYYQYWELFQYTFDGRQFRVTSRERVEEDGLLPGWIFSRPGLTAAIPDGDDLLAPICGGRPGKPHASGIMRWSRRNGAWRPVSFQLVTGSDGAAHDPDIIGASHSLIPEGAIEPSLVRDIDGELLLAARGRLVSGHPMRVWKSSNRGTEWKLIIFNGGISSSPVTIHRAADGTPYIAANRYQYQTHYKNTPSIAAFRGPDGKPVPDGGTRETLMAWPLNDARDALGIPVMLRDGLTEFGPPPNGTVWSIDHPSSQTVQLGDGQWHNILAYRALEKEENVSFVSPTPFTGSYVEEVFSAGPPIPTWNF